MRKPSLAYAYPFPGRNTLKISELRKIVDPPSPPYPFALSRSTGIIDQFLPPPRVGRGFAFDFDAGSGFGNTTPHNGETMINILPNIVRLPKAKQQKNWTGAFSLLRCPSQSLDRPHSPRALLKIFFQLNPPLPRAMVLGGEFHRQNIRTLLPACWWPTQAYPVP